MNACNYCLKTGPRFHRDKFLEYVLFLDLQGQAQNLGNSARPCPGHMKIKYDNPLRYLDLPHVVPLRNTAD